MVKKLSYDSYRGNFYEKETIRYENLMNELIDEYVKKFKSIEPIEVVVEKIVYSMADGTKKEYSFAD
jgi:hypothetical protein